MAEERKIRPLIAGNWKMNGLVSSLAEIDAVATASRAGLPCDLLICPPATLLAEAAKRLRPAKSFVGGQTCHELASGAFTGEISAEMLADLGATHVILGHSERRWIFGETDALVHNKALGAWRAGLTAILCVGEQESERKGGRTLDIVGGQLAASLPEGCTAKNAIVAYEPVWAIGTGLTATNADIAEVHGAIRAALERRFGAEGAKMRILYGGSVKPGNAGEILKISDVNGVLVGGASLKATDFLAIAKAAEG